MSRVTPILAIVIILGGYLYLSKPSKVVINEKGRVEGMANKGKALVQGKAFWERQLKMANELFRIDTASHKPSSADIQALYQKYRAAENALNDKMKDLYTPEEQQAEMYRIKADSIIRASKWRLADERDEKTRLKETERLRATIRAIEAKLRK